MRPASESTSGLSESVLTGSCCIGEFVMDRTDRTIHSKLGAVRQSHNGSLTRLSKNSKKRQCKAQHTWSIVMKSKDILLLMGKKPGDILNHHRPGETGTHGTFLLDLWQELLENINKFIRGTIALEEDAQVSWWTVGRRVPHLRHRHQGRHPLRQVQEKDGPWLTWTMQQYGHW